MTVELIGDQLARDRQVQTVCHSERLRAADRMAVVAERHGMCEHLAIAADLYQRGANPAQPSQGVEGHKASVADEHQAFEPAARAVERYRSALPADPVLDAQLAAVHDAQRNTEAVHDQYARADLQRWI